MEDKILSVQSNKTKSIPTIAIASGKGGVGKSTVTHYLALALKSIGKHVGIVDADIYGPTQEKMFGINSNRLVKDNKSNKYIPTLVNGMQYISIAGTLGANNPGIWRAPIATKIVTNFLTQTHWYNIDILLIDLPPGTGDIPITLTQRIKLNGALIVTTPQEIALNVVNRGLEMLKRVNIPIIGIIENMSEYQCSHCGMQNDIFKGDAGTILAQYAQVPLLTQIPLHHALAKACDEGNDLLSKQPNSIISRKYIKLAKKVIENLDKQYVTNIPDNIKFINDQLNITWSDSQKIFTAFNLRLACNCALCKSKYSGKIQGNYKKILSNVKIKDFNEVGHYGIKIDFTDGHNSGIYTYKQLRML